MSNIVEIPDPRSPTAAFVRTPLRVVKMIIDEENLSTETRINNDIFENSTPGNLLMSTPMSTCDTDDSFQSAIGESDSEPLISSTDTKKVKVNSKKNRRALGCIKNRLIETPKAPKDMRRKLWRNMEEERVKKGVNMGAENTPPLPFKDLTASAPPKLYRHNKCT